MSKPYKYIAGSATLAESMIYLVVSCVFYALILFVFEYRLLSRRAKKMKRNEVNVGENEQVTMEKMAVAKEINDIGHQHTMSMSLMCSVLMLLQMLYQCTFSYSRWPREWRADKHRQVALVGLPAVQKVRQDSGRERGQLQGQGEGVLRLARGQWRREEHYLQDADERGSGRHRSALPQAHELQSESQ